MDDLSSLLPKIASIYGLAFFYFWPAIPAGLALGLSPVLVVLTTSASYISGAALALALGGRVRALWRHFRRRAAVPAGEAPATPDSRIRRIWDRYGIIGLGLAAPMTIGSQTGALLAVTLRARPWIALLWLSIGALVWSLLLSGIAALGLVAVGGS
jgi:uncharacterized membrane protein